MDQGRVPQGQHLQRLYDASELAEALNVSKAWVRKHTRFGLPHLKCGRATRYSLAEVLNWLQAKQSDRN
jgi:predicted DNA-binding transcriptional regulator AlpA